MNGHGLLQEGLVVARELEQILARCLEKLIAVGHLLVPTLLRPMPFRLLQQFSHKREPIHDSPMFAQTLPHDLVFVGTAKNRHPVGVAFELEQFPRLAT